MCLLIILTGACTANSTPDDDAMAAEETLQSIYAQETLSAENASSDVQDESSPSPSPQPAKPPKRPPLTIPNEPPEPNRTLSDSDSSIKAEEHRVLSGDNFLNNLYERPFTSQDMIYQPDLDIYTVDFAYDEDYFYFTIHLNGMNSNESRLTGTYGIEFDRTLTGRGDLIVLALNPPLKWAINTVKVFTDANGDVGGPVPMIADEGFEGNGYDKKVELKGDNLAFARTSLDDQQAIQIAVSQALLGYPEKFLWGAWVDKGRMKLSEFDYNDTMGPSEAGSPFIDSEDYPLNELFNFDNTCRLPYGFEQLGSNYRGMCITTAPVVEPDTPESSCFCNDLCIDGITCCGTIICP